MALQRTYLMIRMLLAILLVGVPGTSGDEPEGDALNREVEAPPRTRSVATVPGGAYFVDESLLDRYDALKSRLLEIRDDINSGRATSKSALESLVAIEQESKLLRSEVEKSKQLVAAFQVYSLKTEQTIELGDERLVIVTGDQVTVRGWPGPGVKCVIEKTILAKEKPAAAEFDAIRVNHKLEVPTEKVGMTREQREQQEVEFLASEDGRKLTDEQRANRKRFVEQIHRSYDDYLEFQGREANTIQMEGLQFDEGNRNLTFRINSPGGGGLLTSQWQRRASLTVYVPPCRALAIRGCLVGLDIQDLEANLVLTTHDSRDRDYEGTFVVRNVKGNVTISQAPVRVLSQVTGDVRFTATDEFVNSGTLHANDQRTFAPYETHTTAINQVSGNVDAHFLRTKLELQAIGGTLNVVNEFGSTSLRWEAVDRERSHRIISQSGSIQVVGTSAVLSKTPLFAFTQCGRMKTNLSQKTLDSLSMSGGNPQRGWHGLGTPSKERFDFERMERPSAAIENRARSPGLDVISHGGEVTISAEDSKAE